MYWVIFRGFVYYFGFKWLVCNSYNLVNWKNTENTVVTEKNGTEWSAKTIRVNCKHLRPLVHMCKCSLTLVYYVKSTINKQAHKLAKHICKGNDWLFSSTWQEVYTGLPVSAAPVTLGSQCSDDAKTMDEAED